MSERFVSKSAIVACGDSLSNAAHASQSAQSPRAVAVRDVSLSQLAPRIHQFANYHRDAQQLQSDIVHG